MQGLRTMTNFGSFGEKNLTVMEDSKKQIT